MINSYESKPFLSEYLIEGNKTSKIDLKNACTHAVYISSSELIAYHDDKCNLHLYCTNQKKEEVNLDTVRIFSTMKPYLASNSNDIAYLKDLKHLRIISGLQFENFEANNPIDIKDMPLKDRIFDFKMTETQIFVLGTRLEMLIY